MISLIQENGKSSRNLKRTRAGYRPENLSIKQLAEYSYVGILFYHSAVSI
jgi:hypothetical protein